MSNKTQIVSFATHLHELGIEIISTGGTAEILKQAQIPTIAVADFTGFPEMLQGRVKTLHPKIHAGILARESDTATLNEHQFVPIDLVVVNLYPFKSVISDPDAEFVTAIENIDIGGPTMIRAAAKNHQRVTVVVDNHDFKKVLDEIKENGGTTLATRTLLAQKAFYHTAEYDDAINKYLLRSIEQDVEVAWPAHYVPQYELHQTLRYGENPHQRAAVYREVLSRPDSLINSKQIQGKSLSYNNLADADAAIHIIQEFKNDCACVIVKHANPCGVATGATPSQAYQRAYQADPTSSFGGIIIFNRKVDGELIDHILTNQFVEVILAPQFSPAAIDALQQKQNIRALELLNLYPKDVISTFETKNIIGGLLLQTRAHTGQQENFQIVTATRMDEALRRECEFAWSIVKHVKSNAIVISKDQMTIGIGAGQSSRVFSTEIALKKAAQQQLSTVGSVLASDAFFPFRDSIDHAADAGIKAIIQPGGSIRDDEVIAAANERSIAMIFTGQRFFSH